MVLFLMTQIRVMIMMLPTPKNDDAKNEVAPTQLSVQLHDGPNDDIKLDSALKHHLCDVHRPSELALPFLAVVGDPKHKVDHHSQK